MLRTLVLLCIAATAVSAFGARWRGGLSVRFDITLLGIGSTAFIELPQSASDATNKGWVQKTRPEGPAGFEALTLWCSKEDFTVCVLTDDTGYIAGLQIAICKDRFYDNIFDWKVQGFTSWTTERDGAVEEYWTTHQYFVTPETLALPAATRVASRNPNRLLQDSAVLVSGFNGELYPISTNVSDITSPNSDFTKQGCLPWMGLHYYYKTTEDLECSAETLFPFFPLIDNDQLIGIGLAMYGKHTPLDGSKDWFEVPVRSAVEIIVPHGPECLYNLADSPGLVTIHTYFIKRPYGVTCLI